MTRVAGTQYTIGSPTRRCAATDRELRTGDRYVAALVQQVDGEGFERVDYSEEAWQGGARPGPARALYGFWRGLVPDPTAKKRLLIDDQSLVELFEQSEETVEGGATEKERLAFRFVLGLILLRKRLLVQEGSKGSTMLVRQRGVPKPPEGPALAEVLDPELDALSVAKVTGMLGAVISGDVAVGAGGASEPSGGTR